MEKISKLSFQLLWLLPIIITMNVHAKIKAPDPVPPLTIDGVEYRASDTPGWIEFNKPNSPVEKIEVFSIKENPNLESDVQQVFIKSLTQDGAMLKVIDTRGREFRIARYPSGHSFTPSQEPFLNHPYRVLIYQIDRWISNMPLDEKKISQLFELAGARLFVNGVGSPSLRKVKDQGKPCSLIVLDFNPALKGDPNDIRERYGEPDTIDINHVTYKPLPAQPPPLMTNQTYARKWGNLSFTFSGDQITGVSILFRE